MKLPFKNLGFGFFRPSPQTCFASFAHMPQFLVVCSFCVVNINLKYTYQYYFRVQYLCCKVYVHNCSLSSRRSMARMQQMLVMKVDSLLTFRQPDPPENTMLLIHLFKYIYFSLIFLQGFLSPFFYLFTSLLHNQQENKEGLELLKTAIAKAGYTSQVSSFHLSCSWWPI